MATIVQRTNQHGQTSYRAQVRRKGAPPLSDTFPKLSDARKAMNGASLMEIAEVLGHKTMAMTLRYSHLSPGHRRTAIERLVTRATTANPEASAGGE